PRSWVRAARSSPRCFQVRPQPPQYPLSLVLEMSRLAHLVTLSRVDDQLGLDAELPQPSVKLLGLAGRYAAVLLAVQDQRRPGRRAEPDDRRALQVACLLLARPAAQQVVVERRVVGGAPAAGQVTDAGHNNAAAKDRPGRDGPGRQVAAVARADGRDAVRVGDALGDAMRYPGEDVVELRAGWIGQVGPGEGLPAPGAAPRVGHEHGVSGSGE